MLKVIFLALLMAAALGLFDACSKSPTNASNSKTDTLYLLRANDTGLYYLFPEQRDIILLTVKTELTSIDSVAHYKIEGTVLNNRDTAIPMPAIRVEHYSDDSILVYSCPMVVDDPNATFELRAKRKGYFCTDNRTPYSDPTGASVFRPWYGYHSDFLDILLSDTSKMRGGWTEFEFFEY